MTAANRCVGHAGGTAGEDIGARKLPAMVTSSTGGWLIPVDHCLVWHAAEGSATVDSYVCTY
jgi:hypothetical protein